MAKKVTKIIHIGLYKNQEEVVRKIEEAGESLAEIVRAGIAAYGKEHFPQDPGYVEIEKRKLALKEKTAIEQKAFDDMNPVDYVKNELHAEVDEKNGVALFINTLGGANPLNLLDIKTISKDHYVIKTHLEVVNGTYIHDNGLTQEKWSKERCENELLKWREYVAEKIAAM